MTKVKMRPPSILAVTADRIVNDLNYELTRLSGVETVSNKYSKSSVNLYDRVRKGNHGESIVQFSLTTTVTDSVLGEVEDTAREAGWDVKVRTEVVPSIFNHKEEAENVVILTLTGFEN